MNQPGPSGRIIDGASIRSLGSSLRGRASSGRFGSAGTDGREGTEGRERSVGAAGRPPGAFRPGASCVTGRSGRSSFDRGRRGSSPACERFARRGRSSRAARGPVLPMPAPAGLARVPAGRETCERGGSGEPMEIPYAESACSVLSASAIATRPSHTERCTSTSRAAPLRSCVIISTRKCATPARRSAARWARELSGRAPKTVLRQPMSATTGCTCPVRSRSSIRWRSHGRPQV